jgi:two-component system phosphate regulon sensor histidine kinase PhoR
MSFLLVGLMVIQVYWIRNAIAVKEASFVRAVEASVADVVVKLEKDEAARRLKNYKQSAYLYSKIDSLNFLINNRIDKLSKDNPDIPVKKVQSIRQQLHYDPYEEQRWRTVQQLDTTVSLPDDENLVPPDTTKPQEVRPAVKPEHDLSKDKILIILNKRRDRLIDELMKKSFLVNEAYENFSDNFRLLPIEKRINTRMLDSLLAAELEANGIITEFEYGIFSPERNLLVIQKTGLYASELLNKGFAITLFPNESNISPNYLIVFFPREKQFVISQLWWMLFVSALLIIAVIALFAYTIGTLIKQKKLSDMKNDFVNNMTHEFKTPIATISLACEALNDKDVASTEGLSKMYIGMINEENRRLGIMAEKILQTAILEKGQLRMKLEPVDIHLVITDAIAKIKLQVEAKDGELLTSLQAQNPVVSADRLHITNVVFNLLDNANKYSPQMPVIKVTTQNSDQGVIIKVHDNGIGISKANQKKVFEKLYRVPTGNVHDVKGFGLGLSYVKTIITKHGGTISLESEPKKGSVFTVFIPF